MMNDDDDVMIIPTIRENRTWNLVLLIVVMLTHII